MSHGGIDLIEQHGPSSSGYRGLRATVMGLGRFGGGVAAARFLTERGAVVTVTDSATEEKLSESLAELHECRIAAYRLGGHREQDFRDADLVVVNPAVPRSNPYLEIARRAGVPLTSEMNLFWQHQRGRIVGVTGSNGKSTTTALIHSILQASGRRCHLGGNIGRSLLPIVDEIGPDDWCVLELSSFQLADLDRIQASPDVAVVTNFSPNHLDWHGTADDYRRCKQAILRWQNSDGIAVLNQDDPDVATWPVRGERLYFGLQDQRNEGVFATENGCHLRIDGREEELPLGEWLKLPGRHNVQNTLAAICAAAAIGADPAPVQCGIESYQPLPYRLQFVAEVNGVRFYNDSLATTPESAIVALEAFHEPIILLAGGYDKRIDLSAMAQAIVARASAVALIGQTAEELERLVEQQRNRQPSRCGATGPAVHRAASFHDAFHWAVAQATPGSVVLLSPGCASYDWFRNFADRGDQFARLVGARQEHARKAADSRG